MKAVRLLKQKSDCIYIISDCYTSTTSVWSENS